MHSLIFAILLFFSPWETNYYGQGTPEYEQATPEFFSRVNRLYTSIDTPPDPSEVLRKSMILPGWGQVVNRQTWKVPLIYGMLGGLAYYSMVMDQNYRDYRAAFYNSQHPDGDQRFGQTPDYIDVHQNPESLRYSRNTYRNRRDLTFIGIALAYGLNIIDAYVFAHMRDFDVSDDLSAHIKINPSSFFERFSLTHEPSLLSGNFRCFSDMTLTLTIKIP